MAPLILLAIGLIFGLLGAATALDVVSLREVAHSLDIPVVSGLIIGLREAMPRSVAHTLEPATAVAGGLVMIWSLMRRPRYRVALASWSRQSAVRAVLVFGVLRAG